MHFKTILLWLYRQLRDYNLFIPEEDDYEDDDDYGVAEDPATVLIKQKYSTWIYVLSLMGEENVSLTLFLYEMRRRRKMCSISADTSSTL